MDFLRSGEQKTSRIILDNHKRRQVHTLARMFDLDSKSTGDEETRTMHISRPAGFDLVAKVQDLQELDADQVVERMNEVSLASGHPTRHQVRQANFEHWVRKKRCGRCGCSNDKCDLGIARNGETICFDCNEADEVLSGYKWEDLQSCYHAGVFGRRRGW